MAEHLASLTWIRTGDGFAQSQYARNHTWTFDGGLTIPATAAPSVIPPPWTDPSAVDPEEAFVAALASCHMLTFLHVACKGGFIVDRYEDNAVGQMKKNEKGVPWVHKVILHPRVTYGGEKSPTPEESDALHHKAHEYCFIANSVKSEIVVEPQPVP
jgi:organic hydroperoxide reductase OsmC/OhrA